MEYRIGLFVALSICTCALHAFAISDPFLENNPSEPDAASGEREIFNGGPVALSPVDNVDSNAGLFSSSNDDECSYSNADDNKLFLIGRKVRIRLRAEESCPNPRLELPDLGLFNPGGGLLDLFTPPESATTAPAQTFPLPEGEQSDIEKLERMFKDPLLDHRTDKINDEEEDPCPADLVSDLNIPVCDSGDYARDVLRFPGDYFFELYNIRYCTYTVLRVMMKFRG
jgi:hypothetical protein